MIYTSLFITAVVLAILIVGLILMQQGKGADAGAAFGAGVSGTVFGARGATSFLAKLTAFFVALFFSVCLGLAYVAKKVTGPEDSIVEKSSSTVEKIEELTPELDPTSDIPE